jgi:hypothetical protein
MFASAQDRKAGLQVGVFSSSGSPADDWAKMVEAMVAFDEEHWQRPERLVFILVVDAETQRPDPICRRQIAAARAGLKGQHLFALVTPSVLIRGVLAALNWIHPPGPRYQTSSHLSLDEAITWAEEKAGRPLPQAAALYLRTRGSMRPSEPIERARARQPRTV